MFSIVSVYNNERILHNCLLKSLNKQTSQFQLILVDNKTSKYNSIPKALNIGAINAEGDYIMFIHQDVALLGIYWLYVAEQFLNRLTDLGIAGVAGVSVEGKTLPKKFRNIIFGGSEGRTWGNRITEPEEVQTLDELLLIVPRRVFSYLKFDENFSFHLYGADYCLTAKRLGLKVYVLPLPVWHLSNGLLDTNYFVTLMKLIGKHRMFYNKICLTTLECWTQGPKYLINPHLVHFLYKIYKQIPLYVRKRIRENKLHRFVINQFGIP
ncbi:MAG: glycosyltransferase [Nitrososphaerota archaeon]